MFYNWDFAKRIKCTDNEKKEAAKVAVLLLNLSEKSRREGMLALEDDFDRIKSGFLKLGLKMAVDGTDPDIIRDILQKHILFGDYKGKDLLLRCLVLEGVLSIQSGDNPRITIDKLQTFFGNSVNLEQLINRGEGNQNKNNSNVYRERIPDEPVLMQETSLIEDFLNYDDRSIQVILREVDTKTLVNAMFGASGKAKLRILDNMSKTSQKLITEDLLNLSYLKKIEITAGWKTILSDAQKHIMNIVRKLEDDGMIVI